MRRKRIVQIPVGGEFVFYTGGPVGVVKSVSFQSRRLTYEMHGAETTVKTNDRIFCHPATTPPQHNTATNQTKRKNGD